MMTLPARPAGSVFIIVREWYSLGTYSAEESVTLHCKN